MNPTDPPATPGAGLLARTLDGLWQRFLSETLERVTVLESAATAITAGRFSPEQREAAQAAAHKLAGVLGTFGLARGTEIARELELALAHESSFDAEIAVKFSAAAAELRQLVESRKASV
jgi:HPt (histidine-containing phosphotransfer) domain-containing protein